ncbi:hypothetical protein PIB30_007921 [Stylosanthes scabra]|uniref:Pectinesterase n=1 Tax=Stylosanthes scabra TaxID=79078 RepID=A0ABU6S482_9FABA|nr:hypothetical protein [Stylosanthes scabra]
MASGKIIVSGVAIILVVGVVIGTIGIINNNNNNNSNNLKTHNKAVEQLCQNADDKKLCHDVIGNVNGTDPKEYVSEVVKRTMDTVIKAANMSDTLSVEHASSTSEPGMKMALDDCKDLLQSAMHELEASINLVGDNNFANVYQSSAELKNWLGAVIAYQQSCMDGFDSDGEKKVQSQLQADSLDSVGKFTALALDVVSGLSHFLSGLGLNLNLKPPSRRLLDVDEEGYPTWMSAADRKLLQDGENLKPNVVVAQDGSGQFKTVLEGINSYPKNFQGRYVIYVKAGVYDEYITVDKKFKNMLIYGDGNTKTIITGRKNFHEGTKTMRTSTFSSNADDFIAKSIAFENTAGAEGHQAVALRIQGDRSAFFDCAMRGYQDTLYAHAHRQFYRNCEISGTIDFIFGYGTTLIQNSKIIVRKPMSNQQNIVVADGTDQKNMPTGIVLQNCEILAAPELFPDRLTVRTFLARPWKAFSRAVFIENEIGDLIQPQGYIPWNPPTEANTDNCFFAEFANTGPGSNAQARAPFAKGIISKDEASQYLAEPWIQASTWVPATGIAYDAGFTKA